MKKTGVLMAILLSILLFSCARESKGATLLHWAAQEGYVDVLSDLLEKPSLAVNQLNEKNETALLLALKNEKPKTAALLLDKGAALDFIDSRGWNYLHWAAFTGAADLAKGFSENPALANGVNKDKNTALHLALERGHREISLSLLKLETLSNVNQQNNKGDTALHLACFKGYDDVVKLILAKKPELNLKNKRGYYAIQLAAEANHKSIVEMLIQAGADTSVIWPARDFLDLIF
ncbi:MAG: ankyrin repeat domain-containing protein [Spirochaetales bacterium]|nr:ankyrin repeat domain-containing protein [Spirochaetales bacterium]